MLKRSFLDGNGNVVEPYREDEKRECLSEILIVCIDKLEDIAKISNEVAEYMAYNSNRIEKICRYDGSDYYGLALENEHQKNSIRDSVNDINFLMRHGRLISNGIAHGYTDSSDLWNYLDRINELELRFYIKHGFRWDIPHKEEVIDMFAFMKKPVEM
jgi:hypothetical protein